MQFLVISHQLLEILWALVLGFCLGAVYDVIRFVRSLLLPIGNRLAFANIFDVLYGVAFASSYCVFIFAASSGHFRWFTFFSTIIGVFVWRAAPSRLFLPILEVSARLIHRLLHLILLPLQCLVRAACKALKEISLKIVFRRNLRKTEKYKKQLRAEVILINGE